MRFYSLAILFALAGALVTMAGPAEDEASAAGQKWLSLLDDQKYEESWTQSSALFRDEVKQDDWVASLKKFREPMGAMISRTPARIDFTKTLRGAPDGDYCIIHFTSAFKNKDKVTERLTLVKVEDKWLMSAYAIH